MDQILEESLESSSNQEDSIQQINKTSLRLREREPKKLILDYKRTYIKVPSDRKQQLYNLVYRSGFKIKDAAKQIGIKYATAKTIIFHHREKRRAKQQIEGRQCKYTELKPHQKTKIRIISSTANDIVESKEYTIGCGPHMKRIYTSQFE